MSGLIAFVTQHEATIIGIILMAVIGPAVGNYACSVVYRLPRGQTPFDCAPYCGHCHANLQPRDLFPIFSWYSARGLCRYCGGEVPAIYTVIELACLFVFISYFLHFGISELFLLYTAYAVMVVTLAAIHYQQNWISSTLYSYALALIIIARTLVEHTIYNPIKGAVVMLVLMLALMRLAGNKTNPTEKPWLWWFVLLGALVPMAQWYVLLPVYVLKLLVPKQARVVVYASVALVLPLLV